MMIEKLNPWLTFLANISVLAGVLFLAIEIQQSNNIAKGNAGLELMQRSMTLNTTFYENEEFSQLAVKLSSPESVLSPEEEIKARFLAFNKLNMWYSVDSASRNGLLDEDQVTAWIDDIAQNFSMFPGLVPYWDFTFNRENQGNFGDIQTMLLKELEARGY